MVFHYNGFTGICEELPCGLFVCQILELDSKYCTGKDQKDLEENFHMLINEYLNQEKGNLTNE